MKLLSGTGKILIITDTPEFFTEVTAKKAENWREGETGNKQETPKLS